MATTSSASMHHKVIILGAGLHGLAAAKTYLDIDPSVDLLVVDGDSGIGGVWSKSRIYPGLVFEQSTPMVNFTDMTAGYEYVSSRFCGGYLCYMYKS